MDDLKPTRMDWSVSLWIVAMILMVILIVSMGDDRNRYAGLDTITYEEQAPCDWDNGRPFYVGELVSK